MSRTLLKKNAKKQLSRNLGTMILCMVVLTLIETLGNLYNSISASKIITDTIARYVPYSTKSLNYTSLGFDLSNIPPVLVIVLSVISLAVFIFYPVLTLGLHDVYLKSQKGEKVMFSQMFEKFSQFAQAFVAALLVGIFIILKFLLLIVPGIIACYQYSMVFFILAENPEMGAYEAIKQSKRLMKGHKFELFVLQLSFFWWYLLVIITFGLAALYVSPYIMASYSEFYVKVKESKQELLSQNA